MKTIHIKANYQDFEITPEEILNPLYEELEAAGVKKSDNIIEFDLTIDNIVITNNPDGTKGYVVDGEGKWDNAIVTKGGQ